MPNISPIPSDAPIVGVVRDPQTGQERLSKYMSDDFNNWLLELVTRQNNTPESVGNSVSVSAANAAISATPAYTVTSTGYYRVSVYARIVGVAATSSSLTPTIAWTDGGVACSFTGSALTGNTTATVGSFTFLVRADQATAITYSTAYASNGAGEMDYDLVVTVEQVPA